MYHKILNKRHKISENYIVEISIFHIKLYNVFDLLWFDLFFYFWYERSIIPLEYLIALFKDNLTFL